MNRTLSHNHNVSVAHLLSFGKYGGGEIDHVAVRIVFSCPSKLCRLTALSPVSLKIRPKKSDNQPSILKKAS